MADPAPAEQPGENFFEPISPEGREPPPSATIEVHNSEKVLREFSPEIRRELFGEEVSAAWSPEEALAELHKKRGREQPNNTIAFARDGRRPAQSDKEAAADVSFSRRLEHADRLLAAMPRLDPETAVATANDALVGGAIHKFSPAKEDVAGPLERGDDTRTAAQRLTALREERAAALHELVGQLSEPADQQLAQTEQPLPDQQQHADQPPPIEQPPAPDPVEQLRRQAEAEKNAYVQLRQATAVEQQLHHTAQWLDQEVTKRYAGQIQTAGSLEAFAKANPAGFKELAEAKQYFDTCQANIQHCRQVELLNQQRAAELQASRAQQERAAWAAEQDKLVEKAIPELANPEAAPALQRAALDTLKGAGITEQELRSLWNGEQTLNLRDHRAQVILSKAAKWDAAQAKAKSARPEPLPAVFRPGTAVSKGEIGAANQAAELNKLTYMSPENAARAGARLLAQRRGSR